jgi:hypothetical protein
MERRENDGTISPRVIFVGNIGEGKLSTGMNAIFDEPNSLSIV